MQRLKPEILNNKKKTSPIVEALRWGSHVMVLALLSSTDVVEKLDLRSYYADFFDNWEQPDDYTGELEQVNEFVSRTKVVSSLAALVEDAAAYQRNLTAHCRKECDIPGRIPIMPLVNLILEYLLYAPAPTIHYGPVDFKILERQLFLQVTHATQTALFSSYMIVFAERKLCH